MTDSLEKINLKIAPQREWKMGYNDLLTIQKVSCAFKHFIYAAKKTVS